MTLFYLFLSVVLFVSVSAVPSVPIAETAFRVYNSDWSSADVFTGEGERDTDFCFVSHGCWGGKPPQKRHQRQVARLISDLIDTRSSAPGEKIRFVIAAGDNFYTEGVRSPFDSRFFTTFEEFYAADTPARRIPWLVALGNHDYDGNFTAQVNYTHVSLREANTNNKEWGKKDPQALVSGRWYMPYPYYALKVSDDVVIVVIDTVLLHRCVFEGASHRSCWDGGRQKKEVEHWLLRKYARVKHKIVVGHYPVMANGPHINYKWLKDWLVPLMRKSCAAIYIHADNHYLQVSQDGFQYYANSGGGAGVSLHVPKKHKSWINPHSVFHEISFGVMLHCKSGDRLTHTVLNEEGKKLFSFETWRGENGAQARQQCLNELIFEDSLDEHTNDRSRNLNGERWDLFLYVYVLFIVTIIAAVVFWHKNWKVVRGRRR